MGRRYRVVATGDKHCGHKAGLTPPRWRTRSDGKVEVLQEECWNWYVDTIESLQPIDVHIENGDAVDGKGEGSGGTEMITSDRDEQVEMALETIGLVRAPVTVVIAGTPYHAGKEEDWEKTLWRQVKDKPWCKKATFSSHEFIDVGGITFDVKHKVGQSQIPHGRATPALRDALWNLIWNADGGRQPKADIILRAHVHYYEAVQNFLHMAMSLPALQAAHTKFGARQMSGTVDFGLVVFDIEEGAYSWQAKRLRPPSEAASALQAEKFLGRTPSAKSKSTPESRKGSRQ